MDTTPVFGESGIKLGPREQLVQTSSLSLLEAAKERFPGGLLRGERGLTSTAPGKAETLQPRTNQQSFWQLYLPPDSRHGICQAGLPRMPTVLESAKHLCVVTAQFTPPSENISESIRNSRFSPSKTGSTARSPWDWEVK